MFFCGEGRLALLTFYFAYRSFCGEKSMKKENMSAVFIPVAPRKAHNMRTINLHYRGLFWSIHGPNSMLWSAFLVLAFSWACKLKFCLFLALSPL